MIKLIYISSPSYSGSTLLTFLMNAHPAIATMGELKWGAIDLETYQCSCGQLLRECEFWKSVASRVKAQGLPFDLNRPATDFRCRGHWPADRVARARVREELFEQVRDAMVAVLPACRRTWPLIADVNQAMIEAILDLQGSDYFLDASKEPVRLKYLADTGAYDIWVIQLVRDARGVTNSAMKNEDLSAEVGATEWLRTHRQIERLASRVGNNRLMRVRYEDLCTDRDRAMTRIYEFTGISATDASRELHDVNHHILGNRMRLSADREIKLDEKWRTMLTARDLATIDRVAGELNRSYGYA